MAHLGVWHPQYACPELLNDELLEGLTEDPERHLKIDVYSFGVTLWEMLTRQRPHADMHPFQLQVRAPLPGCRVSGK